VLVDFAYVRLTYEAEPAAFLDRFGGPYPLLIGSLFVLPLLAGAMTKQFSHHERREGSHAGGKRR
jgi:hypothetical protein